MARASASLLAASVAAAVLTLSAPAYAAAPPTTVASLAPTPADGQVTLRWTNPADADFAGVTVVEKVGEVAPADVTDGTEVYKNTGQSTVVTGLTNGTKYTFAVFTRNTVGDVSDPAWVTATPIPALATTLTVKPSAGGVTYGGRLTITTQIRRGDTNEVLGNEPIEVYRKFHGESAFTKVYGARTNSSGVLVYYSGGLPKNTQWYVNHPPNPVFGASKSATFSTLVHPRLSVRIPAFAVEQNVVDPVSITVTPNHAGQAVVLQLLTNDGWKNAASRALSSTSSAVFGIKTSVLGTRTFRLVKPADADHAQVFTTRFPITVVPRTLRAGMSGADVTAVQRRLAALRYDVGSVNGYFGYDTVHATMAFQKVNRLPVTGAVDARTHLKLRNPTAPVLRYKRSGSWVEVDLTRQVLYYGRNGALYRVLDISSGSGKLFTVDGETQRAVTPMGSFRIYHRIDGLRISRLGSLWRPAYFAQGGYAIHGNSSVPAYPASHGCVRITNSGMNRLFPLLTIGLPVTVYRS